MRTMVIVLSLVVGMAASAALAPNQAAPPTVVGERGIYQCPNHAEIQATWPASCPTCQTVLEKVSSLDAAAANTVLAAVSDGSTGTGQSTPYGASSGSYPPYYPYGTQGYPPYPPSQQYGTQGSYPQDYPYEGQGYPPYPPSGQYGAQGSYPPNYPYGTQGYPPYPPSSQYGTQGSYPPYYPYGTQGYPPYPPTNQYGGQGYPPYNPNYGYGQGGYTPPPTSPTEPNEPNSPYAGLLEELNKLFRKRQQQNLPQGSP